jgi:hypothetical protein
MLSAPTRLSVPPGADALMGLDACERRVSIRCCEQRRVERPIVDECGYITRFTPAVGGSAGGMSL